MVRGVRWYLVGSVVLVVLAGCGRSWFAEREPWRHDAEVECLKSGAVKEGAGVVRIKPIEGPGMCGADFPLRVSALGGTVRLGFGDELRPPGTVPGQPQLRWPGVQPNYAASPVVAAPSTAVSSALLRPLDPAPPRYAPPVASAAPQSLNAPLSLTPLGAAPRGDDDEDAPYDFRRPYAPPGSAAAPASMATRPLLEPPPRMPAAPTIVPLAPSREPQFTGTIEPVAVNPPATLACPIVSVLDQWINEVVQPAALHWFNKPVVEIKQISAYSCRGMNGQPGAHISEHAFGNALDVAAFSFADGYTLTVQSGWKGSPEEQGFMRDVQGGACQQFKTTLAPGYNIQHYNHIHVDLMRRRNGHVACNPKAVPGEVVAAQARARFAGRQEPPLTTGSLALRRLPSPPRRLGFFRSDDPDEKLPNAVPGADGEDD